MPALPPIGAEIPCSMLGINTPIQLKDSLVSVDFRGGIKHRVDVNPDDPINSVRMRTVGFRLTAELPSADGNGGGTVTIEQSDVDVESKSLLRLVQQFPPKYESVMVLSPFTVTIDQPDNGGPQVLVTKDSANIIGQLTQYPPRGDLYQLQNPVELVDPEDPDVTVATIHKLPVKIGGL
ncbi:hypothetical protein ACIRBZ_15090 [Streptomyces sp. NPDC094038]|uniref:hypothetical protein n=1 Tax=Streptomyces sp. NPDC094038 TaxID=3366055 RepID=UPI0038298969